MAISKQKLAAIRKAVSKLAAAAPRPGRVSGWEVLWRYWDLVQLVAEALAPDRRLRNYHDAARHFVLSKEAARIGKANDPELVAALEEYRRAIALADNPPNGGWRKEWEVLQAAMTEAGLKAEGIVLRMLGLSDGPLGPAPAPYETEGRPPRLKSLPAAWFADAPNEWFTDDAPPAADGVNPDGEPV